MSNDGLEAPESPCIGVCTLDAGETCVGCYRTLDEIGAWSQMTVEEQRRVIGALASRRADTAARRD